MTVEGKVQNLHISSLNAAEINLKTYPTSNKKLFWQAAIQYFKHLQNSEYDKTVHKMLIENIQRTRTDVLMIPCFPPPLSIYQLPNEFSLWNVSLLDIRHYEKLYPYLYEPNENSWWIEIEDRRAHMNDANNAILANIIEHWIATGEILLSLDKFTVPTEPIEYYFHE
jgi:hypothetical protein